jgi:hypothetical protein
MFNRLYYAIQRWKFGEQYGCGRCHHGVVFHQSVPHTYVPCTVKGCPCKQYSIQRVTSDGEVGK